MEMTSLARIVCIQRHVRTWVLKRKCRKVMVGVVKMQGLVRKMLAKRLLKKLKVTVVVAMVVAMVVAIEVGGSCCGSG